MNNVALGYVVAYCYLVVIVSISVGLGALMRRLKPEKADYAKELSRKVVHIGCGLGWIILKLFLQGSVHCIFITASFILIAFASFLFDALKIQRGGHDFGLILYTVDMTILATLSYFFPWTFDAFGIGIICLAAGDGSAALIGKAWGHHKWPHVKNKSVEGTVGGLLVAWAVLAIVAFAFDTDLSALEMGIPVAVAMMVELIGGSLDNIIVPSSTYVVAALLTAFKLF